MEDELSPEERAIENEVIMDRRKSDVPLNRDDLKNRRGDWEKNTELIVEFAPTNSELFSIGKTDDGKYQFMFYWRGSSGKWLYSRDSLVGTLEECVAKIAVRMPATILTGER